MSTRRERLLAALVALVVLTTLSPRSAHAKKILLVAGAPSHGYGAHEFGAGARLLRDDLDASGLGLDAEVMEGEWPGPERLAEIDALVLFMDGGPDHPVLDHLSTLEPHLARGLGLMAMHYAVEVPVGTGSEAFQRWLGGFYESGWSTNPHWTADAQLSEEHPIARGVEPFSLFDEWYFNIRFRDEPSNVVPILTAVPDDDARSGATSWPRGPHPHITEASGRRETLLWAFERPDGGRGVGFTGGHFHWNWANASYRRLILNSIAWVAGGEVSHAGVRLEPRPLNDLLTLEPATFVKRLDRWTTFDEDAVRAQFGSQAPAK